MLNSLDGMMLRSMITVCDDADMVKTKNAFGTGKAIANIIKE